MSNVIMKQLLVCTFGNVDDVAELPSNTVVPCFTTEKYVRMSWLELATIYFLRMDP